MQELHEALLALQELDGEIDRAEARLAEYTPRLDTLQGPAHAAGRDLELLEARLRGMREEHVRLEVNAQQKRERVEACHERIDRARTSGQEELARAELDLVRSALEADNADLKQLAEQITRTDLKVDDLRRRFEQATAEIAEERDQLLEQREAVETEIAQLRDRRENQAVRLDPQSRRLYERLRVGRSRMVLAPLTDEGACGNCFNILPLQEQSEVRQAQRLHRCEGCGVILYGS